MCETRKQRIALGSICCVARAALLACWARHRRAPTEEMTTVKRTMSRSEPVLRCGCVCVGGAGFACV